MAASYATVAQLYVHGVPEAALSDVDASAIEAAIEAASRRFDMYASQGGEPLTVWTSAVSRIVCVLAAHDLITIRGLDPSSAGMMNLDKRLAAAMVELGDMSRLKLAPAMGATPSTGNEPIGWAPTTRGWGDDIP